jgi:hypothetical protein
MERGEGPHRLAASRLLRTDRVGGELMPFDEYTGEDPFDQPTEPDQPPAKYPVPPCPNGVPLGPDGNCPPATRANPPPGPTSNFGPCPEGMEHGGGHPGNPCKPVQAASSGGGGYSGPSAPAFNPNAPQPGDDVEKQIWDYINGVLGGKNTAYNDQVVGNMKQDAFRTSTARAGVDKNALSEDLISRGIFRSGIASSGMSSIDRGASAQYSKAVGDINEKKALSDYQNKMQGLTMAQQWLDSKRNYLIQRESNSIQREIGLAQIKLGYAKITSEMELLKYQLAHQGGGGGYDPGFGGLPTIPVYQQP